MMRHYSLLIAIARRAAVASVVVASIARGQAQRDTLKAIPRELVEGLLMPFNMGFGNNTEFTVGDVPASLKPFLFVPKGARVIGGLSNGNSVYVVMTAASPAQEISADFRREQPKLGWTVPANANRSWGFVPAPGATFDNAGLQFCHINQSLEVRPFGRPGATQISVIVQNNGRCGGNTGAFAGQQVASILPTLENPVGTTMNAPLCFQTVGSAAVTGPTSTNERVSSSLNPSQLIDAFAKQLTDSGYKAVEPAAGPVRRTWTRPDSGDTVREVTLQATSGATSANAPACMDVTMSVRRMPKSR
jgi:hypothetical protein